jgi:hypothetical protein
VIARAMDEEVRDMIIRILALVAIILVYAPITARAEDAGLVAATRAEVNEINRNVPTYAKQSKVVLDVSAQGVGVEYYYDGESVRKISTKIYGYGETYSSEAEFYYRGDELLFVYEKFNRYDTQIGVDPPPQVISSEEKRLYFSAGELAALRIDEKELSRNDARWQEVENRMAELAKTLRAASRDDGPQTMTPHPKPAKHR